MSETKTSVKRCAYCGGKAEGKYSIHRDGFGIGPQVPLCNEHGSRPLPSMAQIWERIKERRASKPKPKLRLVKGGKRERKPERGTIHVTLTFNVYADDGFDGMQAATPAEMHAAIEHIALCILKNRRDSEERKGGWNGGSWGFKWRRIKKDGPKGKVKP